MTSPFFSYFNKCINSMYSACIRLNVLCLVAHNYGKTVWGQSESGFSSCRLEGSYSSWIRHLGAVWAQPNLWDCTGAALHFADNGAGIGVTSGTAGVCGFGVPGIVGATGGGCGSCAGLEVQAMLQKCEVWQESAVWLL